MQLARWGLLAGTLLSAGLVVGCNDGGAAPPDGGSGSTGPVTVNPLIVSTTMRTSRTTTWSVNYWQWSPSYGNDVAGTESLVAALQPALLRVGGYNNDANTPDPFDNAQLDAMVAYARAVGAEPILQVPLLADTAGKPPTAATAAAMVQYANLTQGYHLKYFSIGNEPDLYNDQGSIPGFTAADYCTAATAYVTAMKAVDPSIQIVGPDLSYKYQAGNTADDWLTPILQTCGSLFDIISIHRYPFEAAAASLPAAKADPAAFRTAMKSVQGILSATGQGSKPLALTEMNVAYDATSCVLEASPGTVGSALWMADILGSAMQLGLWTSAVWDISDSLDWSLGLIGEAPGHQPRPAYYAYALYASHFGPTLLAVTQSPTGVSTYASRDAADDATEIIAVNWNEAPAGVQVQVTGLGAAPFAPTFVLPAVSLAAIEVPDRGAATAWTYGEAQRAAATGPALLAAGNMLPGGGADGGAPSSGGAGRVVGTGCSTGGTTVCPQMMATSPAITTAGVNGTGATAGSVSFGTGADRWGSYAYAGAGQTAPTGVVTSNGNGLQITGGFVPPVSPSANFEGFGLFYSSSSCLDASVYTGVKFDYTGDLGGCNLQVGMSFSGDDSAASDARGACSGTTSTCYGPVADVTSQANAPTDAGTTTIRVPFTAFASGSPISTLDPTTVVAVQWGLTAPGATGLPDAGGCAANFTVANVTFY